MAQDNPIWNWLTEASRHTNNSTAGEEAGQKRVFSPYSPFANFNLNTSFQPPTSNGPVGFEQPAPNAANNTGGKPHRYERKPRHKTKENRYEYKASGAQRSRQQQPKNDQNRARKHNRKHTLNENFRAGNVASERLTLNTRLNLGVFNKGRTSSPTRSRIVTGPFFSEVNFLYGSQQNRQEPAESRDKGKGKVTDQTGQDLQMQISQYFSNDYPQDNHAMQATYSVKQDEAEQGSPCMPSTAEPKAKQDAPPAKVEDGTSKNNKQGSRSSTPFTWPESALEEHNPTDAPKPCTKGALCTDLSHQHISEEEKANKRYWDLWELKLILQIRQEGRDKTETRRRLASYECYLKRKRQAYEIEEWLASPPKKTRTGSDAFIELVQRYPSSSTGTLQSNAYGSTVEEELERSLGSLSLESTSEKGPKRSLVFPLPESIPNQKPWFALGGQLRLNSKEDHGFSLASHPPELTPDDELTKSMESASLGSTSDGPKDADNIETRLSPDDGPIAVGHGHPSRNNTENAGYPVRDADLRQGLDMLTRATSMETIYDDDNDVIMKGVGTVFDRGHRASVTDPNDLLLTILGQYLESSISMVSNYCAGLSPNESMPVGQPIEHEAGDHPRRNSLY